MLILGLLGMYFDAAVVFVTKSSLFFRLAVAILCPLPNKNHPILSLICPIEVADTLRPYVFVILGPERKDGLE